MMTETNSDIADMVDIHGDSKSVESTYSSLLSLWREDVRCVFQRDPAARNTFEVIMTYPGIQAVAMHRLSHKLWRRGWRFLPRLLSFFARMITNVDIHPGARIGRRFFIDHGACVVIGETAIVGDDVTFYHGVTLGGTSWNKGRRHPEIGNGVLVGAGAKILGAIKIGENVRVGANSVVVQDVPAQSTVVGIPGKIVNTNRSETSNKYGINLDHHLIPDPVGKVIECLLGRIEALEISLEQQGSIAARYQQKLFESCEVDNQICEQDCAGGKVAVGN
jgi:serine O-acetyltransferase